MSWISKVSDLAGKAEDLLNRLDQSTGDVIHNQKARSSTPRPARSSSYAQLRNEDHDAEVHTEELGRSGPSLPSRTHSEFAGGAAAGRKKVAEAFIPSTSMVSERERRDAELMAMLNQDVVQDVEETRSRRSSGGRSVLSVQTTQSVTSEQPPDISQMKSQLWAKETQIAAMRTKISELERKLSKRSDELFELKAEKEMVEQRLAQQANVDSVEELKIARKKAQEQRDILLEECTQLKRKCMAQEEEVRAMGEQLRLAKFNLSENKKEFDQYKEKAQKILQAKEKLVDSLKSEQNMGDSADRPGHLLQAELEEMRVERDLARADLESAQLMVYNLRSEIDEMENQLREEQAKQTEQRKQYLEEKQSWHATVALLNEKVDCARIESEFQKQEMKRQSEDFARKLEVQEAELRKNVEDQRARRREEEMTRGNDGLSLGERLLQKQIELEEAVRNNQILALKLERLQKTARETVIPIDPPSASLSIQHPAAKQAVTVVDSVMFRVISMLRNYPAARLFLAVYFVLLHIWVFFIILTYTPEIHDHTGQLPGNGGNAVSKS
ncbi:Golgin-84 family protein [Ancylostoma caninum]|uniref:Golgin-84 family protein n=1 Tax=Ancylostoma caninum TaxID=29170 RepID=A0A368H8W4_ANCCA|nr:Golgin-84 family protein [Ancylostoma caninum]